MGTTKKKSANAEQPGRFAYEGLERVLHEKARLGIMTSLVTRPEGLLFGDLKRLCALTDGNLSRHLEVLREAGLVEVWKGFENRRPQTLCRLSRRRPRALRRLPRAARAGDPGRDAESRDVGRSGCPSCRRDFSRPEHSLRSGVGGRQSRSTVTVAVGSRLAAHSLNTELRIRPRRHSAVASAGLESPHPQPQQM